MLFHYQFKAFCSSREHYFNRFLFKNMNSFACVLHTQNDTPDYEIGSGSIVIDRTVRAGVTRRCALVVPMFVKKNVARKRSRHAGLDRPADHDGA